MIHECDLAQSRCNSYTGNRNRSSYNHRTAFFKPRQKQLHITVSMRTLISALLSLTLALLPVMARCEGTGQGEFVVANSPYPPYVMPEGHPAGPGIDMEIALRALERLGVNATVQFAPFKRVLAMLERGQADMTTSLSFRPERDAYLLWSEPYRTDTTYIFFTVKGSPFEPASMEDLRGRTVGMIRGFAYPQAFLEDPHIARVEAPQMENLVRMLLAGRFDVIIVNNMAGRYELKATGRMNDVRQASFELRTPDDRGTVMGFSKIRGHEGLLLRFNAEIRRMLADGTVDEIGKKYLP